MERALSLARRGGGWVSPNPMVGAVLLKDGQVVAEGYHGRFGGPHAEVVCLDHARLQGVDPRGGEMVVSLEPCCHQGKTPPCTDALIAAGLRRVAFAASDPNPRVSGGGRKALQEAGIEVVAGVCECAARRLNVGFFSLMERKRPFCLLKWAMTLDGRIATATGDARWISSEPSREDVHALRGRLDAILVGMGTVRADDPLLTCRAAKPAGPQPRRIVLDSGCNLPLDSQVVETARAYPVLVACLDDAPPRRRAALEERGVEVVALPRQERPGVPLPELLSELGRRQIASVLVEGGAEVHGSFLDTGMADRVRVYIAPKIVGGQTAPGAVGGTGVERMIQALELEAFSVTPLGADLCVEADVRRRRGSAG